MRHLVSLVLLAACAHPPAPVTSAEAPPLAPDEAKVWMARAQLASALGDATERDRAIGWVLQLDGEDPWAWMQLGRLWLDAGDKVRAREALAQARALGGELPGLAALDAEAR